jgi:hypothetical protein
MSVTLSCGCKAESQDDGIFCEWDAYSREFENAVAYGCICALCYTQLNARPVEEDKNDLP